MNKVGKTRRRSSTVTFEFLEKVVDLCTKNGVKRIEIGQRTPICIEFKESYTRHTPLEVSRAEEVAFMEESDKLKSELDEKLLMSPTEYESIMTSGEVEDEVADEDEEE